MASFWLHQVDRNHPECWQLQAALAFQNFYWETLIERLDKKNEGRGREKVYQVFCGFCLSGPVQSSICVLLFLSPVI